jgi:5-bromo-4-chloroindolyl phosphate hydrolysis protein
MKVSWKVNTAISVAVCVGAFLASDWLLAYKWWVDLIIGLVFGGITNFFFLQDKKEDHEVEVLPGLSKEDLKNALSEGLNWKIRIEEIAGRLRHIQPKTASIVDQIGGTVQAIYDNFEQDPGDLLSKDAYRFRDSHMERAFKYIAGYTQLSTAPGLTDNEKEKLTEMESRIAEIDKSFTRLLEAFRRHDMDKLSIEGEAMETIFNLDI